MKYCLDTEFHEYKKKHFFGKEIDTIELISIGIVAEDGREYYAICNEFDVKDAWNNEWLKDNVLKSIFSELEKKHNHAGRKQNSIIGYGGSISKTEFTYKNLKFLLEKYAHSRKVIADGIVEFTKGFIANKKEGLMQIDRNISFYAYYTDYDWVVFCWLFGRMIDLPEGFPMYCRDIKQILDEKSITKEWINNHIPKPMNIHNALAAARWNFEVLKETERIL